MKNKINIIVSLFAAFFTACNEPEIQKPLPETEYDMSGFVKGADVSWLSEMEAAGVKFYNAKGKQSECMSLLRNLGMNAIRLRVWVNPATGWCNKEDVLIKAWRANQLGMRIMVDFHYSDSWADPGKQNKPSAWEAFSFEELKTALAEHTVEVLTLLKDHHITPEWVQVGNETGNGMLWNEGKASENMGNYAALNTSGYDAVKAIFPNTLVVVHLQEGDKVSMYQWLFDGLKNNGGKWDVIGMSLYPSAENWESLTEDMIANMNKLIERYGTPIMVCETGMPWDDEETAYNYLSNLIEKCKAIVDNQCLGVLYWEPQAYKGWKEYTLGAFNENGTPTMALDAFGE